MLKLAVNFLFCFVLPFSSGWMIKFETLSFGFCLTLQILKDEATREQYDYAIAHPEEVNLRLRFDSFASWSAPCTLGLQTAELVALSIACQSCTLISITCAQTAASLVIGVARWAVSQDCDSYFAWWLLLWFVTLNHIFVI